MDLYLMATVLRQVANDTDILIPVESQSRI
jgi:hypothetical protein